MELWTVIWHSYQLWHVQRELCRKRVKLALKRTSLEWGSKLWLVWSMLSPIARISRCCMPLPRICRLPARRFGRCLINCKDMVVSFNDLWNCCSYEIELAVGRCTIFCFTHISFQGDVPLFISHTIRCYHRELTLEQEGPVSSTFTHRLSNDEFMMLETQKDTRIYEI